MIPDAEDLQYFTRCAFTGQEIEPLRAAFKSCLGSLLDVLQELERTKEERGRNNETANRLLGERDAFEVELRRRRHLCTCGAFNDNRPKCSVCTTMMRPAGPGRWQCNNPACSAFARLVES